MHTPEQISKVLDFGDEKVFENLFRSHYPSLVSFGVKYVKEKETAEEIVQEVFLNIWTKSKNLEIQTSVKSYLFGAVRNASLNYLKHAKVERAYADQQRLQVSVPEAIDFLELDQLQEKISNALEKIPQKCRQIFELNRFEGKRYKEIANELDLSLKTVENQMGKALKILREELGEFLPIAILFMLFYGGKI